MHHVFNLEWKTDRLWTKEKKCELQFHDREQRTTQLAPDKLSANRARYCIAFPFTIVADGKSASLEGLLIKARMRTRKDPNWLHSFGLQGVPSARGPGFELTFILGVPPS